MPIKTQALWQSAPCNHCSHNLCEVMQYRHMFIVLQRTSMAMILSKVKCKMAHQYYVLLKHGPISKGNWVVEIPDCIKELIHSFKAWIITQEIWVCLSQVTNDGLKVTYNKFACASPCHKCCFIFSTSTSTCYHAELKLSVFCQEFLIDVTKFSKGMNPWSKRQYQISYCLIVWWLCLFIISHVTLDIQEIRWSLKIYMPLNHIKQRNSTILEYRSTNLVSSSCKNESMPRFGVTNV